MDIALLKTTYDGLKQAKEIFSAFNELKNEADSVGKINEAVKKVGEAQDTLFQLREELYRLQEENNKLKEDLSEKNNWNSKIENYKLIESEGGAVVYESITGVLHYICPSCIEKKEIHPLQDRKVITGIFVCTGCGKSFPVKKSKQAKPQIHVI